METNSCQIGTRAVGIERTGIPQSIISGAGEHIIIPLWVGETLGADSPPLLVHIVFTLDKIVRITPIRPGGIGVVNSEVRILLILPPAVTPLESDPTDGITDSTLAGRLFVDLLPLTQQKMGLVVLILLHGTSVEGVTAELCEHNRDAQLLVNLLVEISHGDTAVNVGAHDVQALTLLDDDVNVAQITVGHGDRMVRIQPVQVIDDSAHETVQVTCFSSPSFILRQSLDLERGPVETIVILISQQPHQQAGRVPELDGQLLYFTSYLADDLRIAVVGSWHPDTVDGQAVASDGVV